MACISVPDSSDTASYVDQKEYRRTTGPYQVMMGPENMHGANAVQAFVLIWL